MAFNAREYLQSIERPTYIDVDKDGNEVKVVGKLASFNEVVELADRLNTLVKDEGSEAELTALVGETCQRLHMADAIPYINALPLVGRIQALTDFFLCLRVGRVQQNPPK